MVVKINLDGEIANYDYSEYSEGKFILNSKDKDDIIVSTPLILDDSFKNKDFFVYLFAKKDIKESDIFEVHCKYTRSSWARLGWLIPIISLDSNDHNFAENPHFLKYAYIGAYKSLELIGNSVYSKKLQKDVTFSFSDIFHESSVAFVVSKELLVNFDNFEIERLYPGLISFGYSQLGTLNPDEITLIGNQPTGKVLKIEAISEDINNYKLINDLLFHSYVYEKKAVFKFFYLYQIIELLIEIVYKNEQNILVAKLIEAKEDLAKTKDIIGDIQEYMSEKKRITLLINTYSNVTKNDSLNDLRSLCNSFLVKISRKEGCGFDEYLYPIRNFIFHQYKDFPPELSVLLDAVVVEFLDIFPLLLSSFSLSNRTR